MGTMCEIRNITKSSGPQETVLPDGFHPTPYTVIIGRGQRNQDTLGNKRLKIFASSFLPKYSEASCKIQKSNIVSEIVATIRHMCPVGAFVRFKNGHWFEVDEATAREKVGYTMRDLLHDKYRSSSKSKVARKKFERSKAKTSGAFSDAFTIPPLHFDRHHRSSTESEFIMSHDQLMLESSNYKDLEVISNDLISPLDVNRFFLSSTTTEPTISRDDELNSSPCLEGFYQINEIKKTFEEKNLLSEFSAQSFFEAPSAKFCNDFPSTSMDRSVSRLRNFTKNYLERIGVSLFDTNNDSMASLGFDDVTPDFLLEEINDDFFEE